MFKFKRKKMDIKKVILKSGLFDKLLYIREYRDARLSTLSPIDHYCQIGIKEDRKINPTFDAVWYREYYVDVKKDGGFPILHYIFFGEKEYRFKNGLEHEEYEKLVSEGFDVELYKNSYDDLTEIEEENFDFILHYIRHGKFEDRNITKIEASFIDNEEANWEEKVTFDTEYYLENNLDVKSAGIEPESHYFDFGEMEGRKPNKFFDPTFYYQLNADVRVANISAFYHFQHNGFQEGRLGQLETSGINQYSSKTTKPILFVGHDGIVAGAQTVLLEVVRWFAMHTNRRIKTLLLDVGPMANDYIKYGEVYVLSNKQVDDVEKFKCFLCEDFEFTYLSTVLSGRFLKLLKENKIEIDTDIITNIHEMEKVLDLFPEELQELQHQTKHWISGSPESTKVLLNKYKVPAEQLTTIPAFINPIANKKDKDNQFKKEARKILELDNDAFVVMGCGTAYWRKAPDIFLETAKKLKNITNKNIQFVWIGDGEDKENLESTLALSEKEYIHFIGHQNDAEKLLAAGDVFFLSSREDPFPLVCLLAAQHHIPTLCFKEATGITEFVQNDAGICLPEISSTIASEALNELACDDGLLKQLGKKAHERVFSSYTTEKKMVEVFNTIKNHTHYKPSVSVIVPVYNHENYIEERMDSILNQEVKDVEVIVLDDCSTDGSVEKIKPYLTDPRVTLHLNKNNSGSPFKQWKKGIELAKSDIVWIAEGDDSCSMNFLSQLLPYFDDQLVSIAYAKVQMTDENGDIEKDAFKKYFDDAYDGKFDSNYIKSGVDEVNEQLGAVPTLINASGLLIRKSSFGNTLEKAQNYRMCGDWLIYLECLKNSKIAYNTNAINYFRRHTTSQVHIIEGTNIYFDERKWISEYVFENYNISKRLIVKAFSAVEHEWSRFKYKHPGKGLIGFYDKKELFEKAQKISKEKLPSIAVIVSDFSPGGGQLFSIRLANAWKKNGGEVILINVGKFPDHPEVLKQVDLNVPIFRADEIDISDLMNVFDIDVIHSSIWWADKYVHEIFKKLPEKIRWVVSMHGCYETLIENMDAEPKFMEYFENMLFEVDAWVYTAEKNKKIFELFYQPKKITKVLNGFSAEVPQKIDKGSIGIRSESIVFCLASRAIESKGWYVAVDAVRKLNELGLSSDLLLIGEGKAKDIIEKTQPPNYIHFIGQVSNLADYINISDVGLLPTSFIGESMPLILIEFMAQGKPMITTDVGEIMDMVTDKNGSAALILDLRKGKVCLDELVDNMIKMHKNKKLRKKMGDKSKYIFKRFEMSQMIASYKKIYMEQP